MGNMGNIGPVAGQGRRGGRPQQYPATHQNHQGHQSHHYHHSINQPIYPPGYMVPYSGAPSYYVPTHYQNNAMAAPGYLPYPPPTGYSRSPPSMQQYVPMAPPAHYSRLPQSPIVPAPYQVPPPQVHAPVPPHTPSSTQSHAIPPPATPPVAQIQEPTTKVEQPPPPPPQLPAPVLETQRSTPAQPEPSPSFSAIEREPFRPPLPWFSVPDSIFPSRAPRSRRRKRMVGGVEMKRPNGQQASYEDTPSEAPTDTSTSSVPSQQEIKQGSEIAQIEEPLATTPKASSKTATYEHAPRSETPSTQDQPSEDTASTSPTTPSSGQASQSANGGSITVASKPVKPATRSAVPTVPPVPVLPALPKASPKDTKPASSADRIQTETSAATEPSKDQQAEAQETPSKAADSIASAEEPAPVPAPVLASAKPTSWAAKLFAKTASPNGNVAGNAITAQTQPDGSNAAAEGSSAVPGAASGFAKSNVNSIAEALQAYHVAGGDKLTFLEPRGLVNTGNMCYMNSVLQVLVFCVPFFDFLDQVSKKAAYSFDSKTPLLDAMIMFMREFKVIDSAASAEQLRRRLKSEELEQYGEQFTPEFVYDAIRKLPRFASMRRGHQQDAEEFLGFLLEGLHDECAQVMRAAPPSTSSTTPNSSLPSPTTSTRAHEAGESGDDWLEVGPRQRAAITRSSGYSTSNSPITKIFGGQLRSELRVPGRKHSVTLEPYQPLQLDIGAPEIRNIVDALKGITRPETLHGDFKSPHGKDARATKQVFIESLPPVLILHLKRFQFDAEGGTIKIWKKIGYPLELEIPRDVLSRQKRNHILGDNASLPKYRLSAVVYHHGKNASGGHYTVDVRRQDGREWIRIDDTVIRRVRSEDVAEGGAEEEAPKAGHADSRREASNSAVNNRFTGINEEEAVDDDDGWKQATANGKKWSSVVNGASAASANLPKAKQHKDSIKDNKVAYLLFYQRI